MKEILNKINTYTTEVILLKEKKIAKFKKEIEKYKKNVSCHFNYHRCHLIFDINFLLFISKKERKCFKKYRNG